MQRKELSFYRTPVPRAQTGGVRDKLKRTFRGN